MKNQGITLIALIITIVIMMILVGVTVSISINLNLFKKSQETIFKEAIAKLEEEVYGPREISKYTGQTYDYSGMVSDELKEYIEISDDGILMFIGEPNTKQSQWVAEKNILSKQEYILKDTMEELLTLAKQYVAEGNSTKAPNLLALQYIRKGRYDSGTWASFAGQIDTNFVNYVEENKTDNLVIENLKDPETGNNIDFVHCMATLNVYLEHKDSRLYTYEYTGWAGDLCSLTIQVNDYKLNRGDACTNEELKNYTNSLLASTAGGSTFSLDDMLADIDAANIKDLVTGDDDLYEAIYDYYYGENKDVSLNRYKKFTEYLEALDDYNSTSTQSSDPVLNITYEILGYRGGNGGFLTSILINQLAGSENYYDSIETATLGVVAKCFAEYINSNI